MSGDLTKYNAAKHALAEAVRIDEVKDIRDKAVALRAYAMQARDRVLIDQATEIRLRAERRVGQLLADMPGARGNPGGRGAKIERSQDATTQPTLSDLDINKTQSSRWQKLAGLAEDDFEMVVTKAQHKASAAVDHARQPKPKSKPVEEQPHHSRYISREIRAKVWQRDEARCQYVGPTGHVCGATRFLELDHIEPWSLGGSNDPKNLRLLCKTHNLLRARKTFGDPWFVNKPKILGGTMPQNKNPNLR